MQAVGPQDLHLSINPDMSFFDHHIVRHTPFTLSHVSWPLFDIQPTQTLTFNVPADGDVLSDLTVFLTGMPVCANTGAESLLVADAAVSAPFQRLQVLIDGKVAHDVDAAAYYLVDSALCDPVQAKKLQCLGKTDGSGIYDLFIPIKFRVLLPLIGMTNSVVTVKVILSDHWANVTKAELFCTYTKLGDEEVGSFQNLETDIVFDQFESSLQSNSVVDNDMEVFYKTNLNVDLGTLQSPTKCIIFAVEENTSAGRTLVDVVESAQLSLGGVSVQLDPQPGKCFSLLNAYKFTDGFSKQPVYIHSFCLNPISPSPCGR